MQNPRGLEEATTPGGRPDSLRPPPHTDDRESAGVRNLAGLEGLRSLRLGGPLLGGPEVCEAVVGLPHLRSLHLIDVPIGDGGLAVLQRLPGLWNLYLDGAGVSDDAWIEYFRACPNVHVHIDQAHHDRDPRRHD